MTIDINNIWLKANSVNTTHGNIEFERTTNPVISDFIQQSREQPDSTEIINLNGIPVEVPTEPTITILNQDGSELITTNNPTTLQYIRLQIKRQNLKGYKILTMSGTTIAIFPNGKLAYWADDIPGALFDMLTMELI